MAVDKATVARIAKLARIHVPEARLDALAGELSKILGWIEQLSELDEELDAGGVAPMTSVVEIQLPRRPDRVTDGDCRDQVIGNAPDSAPDSGQGFFVVPKVIE